MGHLAPPAARGGGREAGWRRCHQLRVEHVAQFLHGGALGARQPQRQGPPRAVGQEAPLAPTLAPGGEFAPVAAAAPRFPVCRAAPCPGSQPPPEPRPGALETAVRAPVLEPGVARGLGPALPWQRRPLAASPRPPDQPSEDGAGIQARATGLLTRLGAPPPGLHLGPQRVVHAPDRRLVLGCGGGRRSTFGLGWLGARGLVRRYRPAGCVLSSLAGSSW
jgi:hypothetical protein